MMEKEKLRKADIFSGAAFFLFGVWIVRQAFKMPMKDSWGGVQNVWFVSPALFPLFVGLMIMLLGALLCRTALKTVGISEFRRTVGWLASGKLVKFLATEAIMRFYAIAVLFLSLVYLTIPRVDFFLSAVLFLTVFMTIFYFDDPGLLKKLLFFYLAGVIFLIVFFAFGLDGLLGRVLPYAGDLLVLGFIIGYCIYARLLIRSNQALRRKYRISLTVSIAAPFIVGPIFKYFLLVPMPTEGLIVFILDALWYLDF